MSATDQDEIAPALYWGDDLAQFDQFEEPPAASVPPEPEESEPIESIATGKDVQRERWALKQEVGNVGQKALLLAIAVHAGSDTLATWLGSDLLCDELACKRSTLITYANGLGERGLIASVPLFRKGGRGQSATLYVLNVDGWLNNARTVAEVASLCNTRAAIRKGIPDLEELPPKSLKLGHEGANGARLPALL